MPVSIDERAVALDPRGIVPNAIIFGFAASVRLAPSFAAFSLLPLADMPDKLCIVHGSALRTEEEQKLS
jgi:hypothetical protein